MKLAALVLSDVLVCTGLPSGVCLSNRLDHAEVAPDSERVGQVCASPELLKECFRDNDSVKHGNHATVLDQ